MHYCLLPQVREAINGIVLSAKEICRSLFQVSLSHPDIHYSYYLWGEWGEIAGRETWCHEGVDFRNIVTSTAPAYNLRRGYVQKSSISGKYVNIWDPFRNTTVNYQHLNSIDGLGALREGQFVDYLQFLGNQNTTDTHVHVQVCGHGACQEIHSGKDLNLIRINPYSALLP